MYKHRSVCSSVKSHENCRTGKTSFILLNIVLAWVLRHYVGPTPNIKSLPIDIGLRKGPTLLDVGPLQLQKCLLRPIIRLGWATTLRVKKAPLLLFETWPFWNKIIYIPFFAIPSMG